MSVSILYIARDKITGAPETARVPFLFFIEDS